MKILPRLLLCVLLALNTCSRAAADQRELLKALATGDISAVREVVGRARQQLGDKAGEPEVVDKYQPIPSDGRWLTAVEAQRGFGPDFAMLQKLATWRIGDDPRAMTVALRAPASVMSGCVAVSKAGLDGAEQCEKLARETAEFLMWAQEQAGTGVFPFPAARGTSKARAMESATRFLERAEKAGRLGDVVRNGWAFDDLDDGGLQFDNAECGVAMFEMYELTHDPRHLASARRAADWAATRPLCTNWNYNSFSVWLLAKAYGITHEESYRDAALKKARLGVMPGQLTDGPRAGRWLDPHNARPAYHYIMLRALAQLAAELPEGDARADVMRSLALGLRARNHEIVTRGAMTKDKAMETLLMVSRLFVTDAAFLRETQSDAALEALGKLVSEQSRKGSHPLGPREWGLFLTAAKRRGTD